MASKNKLKIVGLTIECPEVESEELAEEIDMEPEEIEACLIDADRLLMTLPPGITKRNGVTIDREAVHQEIQRHLRVCQEVRRTQEQYDDALVRVALASGKWGKA